MPVFVWWFVVVVLFFKVLEGWMTNSIATHKRYCLRTILPLLSHCKTFEENKVGVID